MLRNQDIMMDSDAQLLGKANQASIPPSLLQFQQMIVRAPFPRQGFAQRGSCAPVALHAKCFLWALESCLLFLQYDWIITAPA